MYTCSCMRARIHTHTYTYMYESKQLIRFCEDKDRQATLMCIHTIPVLFLLLSVRFSLPLPRYLCTVYPYVYFCRCWVTFCGTPKLRNVKYFAVAVL